ncbi:hypothetical protein P885DRAFT_42468 [Corynascus similis CBS 632.67]
MSWFKHYHTYQAHVEYLHSLSKTYRSLSRTIIAGKSFERRPIEGVHVFGRPGPGVNPAVVFFGTIHAREWITTMVTEYIAYNLLQQYSKDKDVQQTIDSFDFYIFPIVNPDGFVHSQTKNRMWRKNRQRQNGSTCVGRDLNRNWNIHWDQKEGAATGPCRSTYRGSKPFDAPETRALADELQAIKERQGLRLFIDWHAFGQLVMYRRSLWKPSTLTPMAYSQRKKHSTLHLAYGYSCDKKLPPLSSVSWLAGELAEAIGQPHGTRYRAGTACELLYPTSGDSADYVFETLSADYAYTVELRPGLRVRGPAGFRLPEGQILATAEEAWVGVRRVLRFIRYPN